MFSCISQLLMLRCNNSVHISHLTVHHSPQLNDTIVSNDAAFYLMLDITDCLFSLNGVHDYCLLNNEILESKNKLVIDRIEKQVIVFFHHY